MFNFIDNITDSFLARFWRPLPGQRRNWSPTGRRCSQRWSPLCPQSLYCVLQVYDEMPTDLKKQMVEMEKHVDMYKDQYPLKVGVE